MCSGKTRSDYRNEAIKTSGALSEALADYIIRICKKKNPSGKEVQSMPEAVKAYNELAAIIMKI